MSSKANQPLKQVASLRWRFSPAWRKLAERDELPLDDWFRQGQVEVVKHGRHRTVYRVDLPHQSFFVKHDHRVGFWRRVWQRWFGSAAQREFSRTLELQRRALPTVEPVACGWAAGAATDNVLVTVAVAGARSLNEYVAELPAGRASSETCDERRHLIDALAALVAAAHRAGVCHNDLHGGNLLVAPADASAVSTTGARAAGPRLFLVDVPGVELRRALSWRAATLNLVMLNHDWRGRASRRERLRWLRQYLEGRADLGTARPTLREAAAEVSRLTDDYSIRLVTRRDRRAWQENRDYHQGATDAADWFATRDVPAELIPSLLATLDSLRARRELVRLGGDAQPVDLLRIAGGMDWLPARWRYRHARSLWHDNQSLWARGIATPRGMLLATPRNGESEVEATLVVQPLASQRSLAEHAAWLARLPADECARQLVMLAGSAVRLLGQLHVWRIYFQQISPRDLVVYEHEGRWSVAVNVGARLRRSRRERIDWQSADLVALGRLAAELGVRLAPSDSWRVLKVYRATWESAAPTCRELWQRVT
ncbi:MAG: phosphotransferase [Planctomycetes bacterium]|nr:phosphotransferase [Planctomycetota bacterium]